MHNTFKNTKHHPFEVEGDGIMVCLYATHYDFKKHFIKYLCHLFMFYCHFCFAQVWVTRLMHNANFNVFYFQIFEAKIVMVHVKKRN
jgi:hypothetical protein